MGGLPLFTEKKTEKSSSRKPTVPMVATYPYALTLVNIGVGFELLERGVEELDQGYPHPP